MEKIIQIEYQGRNFSIEEKAFEIFQQYEKDLKDFFKDEDAGEEIFTDLQYRMSEILAQKSVLGNITITDINDLISMIGKPSDFAEEEIKKEQTFYSFKDIKKKLFRNKKDKMIAGVCSGIANYFAIDPIAVRLIFVLFTVFNIVTFLSFNIGIITYIILWIILTPTNLEPNVTKKLFRNPKDKVIGGVCSGIAQFFNSESWIIRLIFIAPIIIGVATSNSNFGLFNSHHFSHTFFSLSFLCYIVLMFIIPVAKTNTDYMLLKGEPINLSSIQHSTTMQNVHNENQSGINKFLKVIAYFIIGVLLLIMIPTAIGILFAFVYSYNIADIILFTTTNKIFAFSTILFFIALPVASIIIWVIRKIIGAKKNKMITASLIGLNILGWVSLMFLIVAMINQYNTYSSHVVKVPLSKDIDTLHIVSTDTSNLYNETVFFDIDQMNFLMEKKVNSNEIKAVNIEYENSDDSTFIIEFKKSSFGENRELAYKHAEDATFSYQIENNFLKLPAFISVSNKEPYYLQNIDITIKVPKGKTVITDKKYLSDVNTNIHSSNKGFYIKKHNKRNVHEDFIFTSNSESNNIKEEKENKLEKLKETKEKLHELEQSHKELIKQKEEELKEAKQQMKEDIDDLKKEIKEK